MFSVLSVKFAFDVELLAVANLCGLKVVRMPVDVRLTKGFWILEGFLEYSSTCLGSPLGLGSRSII